MSWIQRRAARVAATQVASALELGLGAVVARRAQSLPIALIPEQYGIAAVRLDMVNGGCSHDEALPLAIHAQRMLGKVQRSSALPTPAIVTIVTGVLARCVARSR